MWAVLKGHPAMANEGVTGGLGEREDSQIQRFSTLSGK